MILLPVVLLLLSAATRAVSPVSRVADADDPPARVARISYLKGSVSLQVSGDTGWSEATLNYPVTTGDRLYTDQDSRAELQVGRFAVRFSESTDLTLTNLTDDLMQLGLTQGTIRVSVYELPSGDSIEVDTPSGALSLLEVGEYRVAVASDSASVVSVDRGSLEVSAGDVRETVERGQAVRLTGTNPAQVGDVTPGGADSFDAWSAERDRLLSSPASAQYVSRDIPGSADLDEAGNWQVDLQYGPVWYPSGVPVDWVPYRYGHWVWVEPWGWTWMEDEPWGFAPFHYGRWVHVGSAWGWLPGPVVALPCYAPALVVFSDGSAVPYGGGVEVWFPLGPGEPYYPWYHHSRDYRLRVNETNLRNVPNLAELVRRRNVNSVPYRNRGIATTVASRATFSRGEPIAPHVLRVRPEHVTRALITPHPGALPTARAAAGGPPAARPPEVARPVITVPAPRRVTPPGRGYPAAEPPRGREVPGTPPRVSAPAPLPPNPPSVGARSRPAVRTPPPLVAKRPPPPAEPPFPARQNAMQAHPGRPLEPGQVENLRAGRPAGPMRDQEVPAHPAAPRAAPTRRPAGKP